MFCINAGVVCICRCLILTVALSKGSGFDRFALNVQSACIHVL